MPATTNNRKILDKEFLEDSIYLYDKNYTHKKQNIIDNQSPHINLEAKDEKDLTKAKLNINISNDNDRKDYDYLISNTEGENTLKWISPVYSDKKLSTKELINYDRRLLSAKALNNFQGTENINTVGEITTGTWNAGAIKAKGNISATGNLEIKGKINSAGFTATETNTDTINSQNINTDNITSEIGKITNLNTDTIVNSQNINTNNITSEIGKITNLTATSIVLENEKNNAIDLDKNEAKINVSTIKLTGNTVIKTSDETSNISVGDNIEAKSSTIKLTGNTVIKTSDETSSISVGDNINLIGNVYIAPKEKNFVSINADGTSLLTPFTIKNSNNDNLIEVNNDNCIINNNTIKLGNGIVVNYDNSWVTTINGLILGSKSITIGNDNYVIDKDIATVDDTFNFSFFETE